MQLYTAAQMKELDRQAIEERGVPSLELMEHAAQAVADAVWEILRPGENEFGPTVIGGAVSIGFLRKKDAPPPDGEEQRQMNELRSIIEGKNSDPTPRVAVFCGPGNNGGDGVACARLLMDKGGCHVRAFFVGDRAKMTLDERAMEEKLIAAGGKLEDFTLDLTDRDIAEATYTFEQQKIACWLSTCDCMVDALFGIGLTRPIAGPFIAAVRNMSGGCCPVVACDIPSGVHADTGEVLGEAVQAKITVTFTAPKPGLYLGEGAARAGEVRVVAIGIPDGLLWDVFRGIPRVEMVHSPNVALPRRPANAHKGDFGKVFILAGSEGYTGAPVMAARAALRMGAGLVYLGVPREVYPIVAVKCDEAMPFPLPKDYNAILAKARSCDIALMGPGLGRGADTLVLRLLADLDIPVVLDADGIIALSGHIDSLDKRSALTVLTPHEGEFSRLTGCTLPVRDRLTAARDFAQTHGCVLVLKGHGTVTATPDGSAYINTTGNPGMAKGGSGDVLAGMIAALLGQKHLRWERSTEGNAPKLVADAVLYHGQAGDECAVKFGEYAMLPTDLIETIPQVLRQWSER